MKRREFTLVEVLIASAIITTTALALYSAMFSARSAVYNSRIRERVLVLISQRIEEMAKCKFRDIVDFGKKYPAGKNESIKVRTFNPEDYKSSKDVADYTPQLHDAQMTSYVIDYGLSCKIVVKATWNAPGDEAYGLHSAQNHVFKYDDR